MSMPFSLLQEVVSLGHGATHVSSAEAGVHLSPAEFHQHLLAAASEQENALSREGDRQERGIVVLDARNMYETRIGHFQQLPGELDTLEWLEG
jgi:predicted sulfurtransferase